MDRNRNYESARNWEENEQGNLNQGSRNFSPPNRIDYRNDERERFRGAYRLDNNPQNRDQYQRLNQENYGTDYGYGHAGNSRNGADRGRHQSDYGTGATYGASRNAGSMGSYGGAQGYGSGRGGYHNSDDRWASGHSEGNYQPERRLYGAYRDENSFAPGERQSYDGSSRYGSQGADNTRGWRNSEEPRERSQSRYNRFNMAPEDDSRYEIYDTSESQYNRGNYNNSSDGTITDNLNLRSHQPFAPREAYGSRERPRFSQGSGYDEDQYNDALSLGFTVEPARDENYPQNRYYDPLSGDARKPGRWR